MTTLITRVRRAQYNSMPWRNGLGMTLEIARDPEGAQPFQWRLSLATISQSAPFSRFAGFKRSVSLVDGRGFDLQIAGQTDARLRAVGDTACFCGASDTNCTLVDGACTDLSLMVHEPGSISSVTMTRCDAEQAVRPNPGAMQALFCLEGEAVLTQHGNSVEFARHDTVIAHCQEPSTIRAGRSAVALVLRLEWRLR
jgi:uncharacterized protein